MGNAKRLRLTLLFWTGLFLSLLFAQEAPFRRGVNLTGWFQAADPRKVQFTKYTRTDFERIKSLGCDVIRLPINLHAMTGGAPGYRLDPLFLRFLDAAVDWAEDLNLHLILDNHTFDPAAATDPGIGEVLEKVWTQTAAHYRDRSHLVYYEILNEPHGISDALWNDIQQRVIRAIRAVDTVHTIIVGPANWNSYNNLDLLPVYADDNLIYTFHFYDPFLFTHQGASWTEPSLAPLSGVPFPYRAPDLPALPPALRGSWVEYALAQYQNEGTVARVKELIDAAVRFRDSRGVPVFCGEFGVYIPNSRAADRIAWYELVRTYLEEKEIAWTTWDYHGGFGLFQPGGQDLFDHDLNVPLLAALGLNAPPQTPYRRQPERDGFVIYDDYIGPGIYEAGYGDGMLSFYDEDWPAEGDYYIAWTGAGQYHAVGFDFRPDKDLSYLVGENYVLDFWVRGDRPAITFDIRFVDSKTSEPSDRPWRMRVTIDESRVPWDDEWHRVSIPLADFTEHGAWDNGWFPPEGRFDWREADRLEIVAEQEPLGGANLGFDQIQITRTDVVDRDGPWPAAPTVRVFPNPMRDFLVVEVISGTSLTYELFDARGAVVRRGVAGGRTEVDLQGLPGGLYLLNLKGKSGILIAKRIIK